MRSAIALAILCLAIPWAAAQPTRQATGVKVGEVTDSSAVVWMRLTANADRNQTGVTMSRQRGEKGNRLPEATAVETLHGACPGAPGRVRFRYATHEDLRDAKSTDWAEVSAATDFTHQFLLTNLAPDTTYYYAAETAGSGGSPVHAPLGGRFKTAPRPQQLADVTFTVVTGMMYQDLDHPDGFHIYKSMLDLRPDFLVLTGDTVYYDNDDLLANTVALARHHWHRMYGLPRLVAFHLAVPAYWMKDDHDTLSDDCWPGRNPDFMRPMTFGDGQRIFREQAPVGEKTYRSFRWGKALQIWLGEVRDFRSPNTAKDGPDKTIWGAEQKRWLKESLRASDAHWRVLVHPLAIVGPDRKNKNDNHSNEAFAHEGDEFRRWAQENVSDNFFVICGDRHWQYHSVHPETGLHEFSCGPASDQHAGGSPGEDPRYHRFHRVNGGFLSVSVGQTEGRDRIVFRFHDVHGKVVYEYAHPQPPH